MIRPRPGAVTTLEEEYMARLDGARALVTGGGTGIGFGCAEQLLAAGAATVTIAGPDAEVLEGAAERLGADRVRTVVCDITEEDQVEQAVARAAVGGRLDVLVANAGTGRTGAILTLDAQTWDVCLRLNVIGSALTFKHAALVMKEHGGGSIVAISSTSGTKVQPWLAAYNASKAALDMLVRSAAVEFSPHRIRVNSIQPGYVPTEAMAAGTTADLSRTLVAATPLGRAGSPADIGRAVAFLASADAEWITGQSFGVDGGLNIPVMPSMAALAVRSYGQETVDAVALPDFTALGAPPS